LFLLPGLFFCPQLIHKKGELLLLFDGKIQDGMDSALSGLSGLKTATT
jgi:hypothetical protein